MHIYNELWKSTVLPVLTYGINFGIKRQRFKWAESNSKNDEIRITRREMKSNSWIIGITELKDIA